jgi:hypothetical protein
MGVSGRKKSQGLAQNSENDLNPVRLAQEEASVGSI